MPEDSSLPSSNISDFEIREAHSADVDALARLETERFASDRLSRRSLAALAKSRSATFLVADRGGALLGYAILLTRSGGHSARLYSIAVAAKQSGRGIGLRLLSAIEASARRRGVTSVRLEVRADNSPAISLYERSGYASIGRRPRYYEDGMTALLFLRDLLETAPARSAPGRLSRAA